MKYRVIARIHQRWLDNVPRKSEKESSWPSTISIEAQGEEEAKRKAINSFHKGEPLENLMEWITVDKVIAIKQLTKAPDIAEFLEYWWNLFPANYIEHWEPSVIGIDMVNKLRAENPETYELIFESMIEKTDSKLGKLFEQRMYR